MSLRAVLGCVSVSLWDFWFVCEMFLSAVECMLCQRDLDLSLITSIPDILDVIWPDAGPHSFG
jgi:hypothetical protein